MITTQFRKGLDFFKEWQYVYCHYKEFDFETFKHIYIRTKGKKDKKVSYADLIIMADTETSKKDKNNLKKHEGHNHVVCWSIAFRAYNTNICTLYGRTPWEFCDMLKHLRESLECDEIYIYFHNMPYDMVFLRRFLYKTFGTPKDQLNIKPLYPLCIRFDNGLIFKDSLAVAQKSIERWANDLDVEHKKAVGSWDYDKIRNQDTPLDEEEMKYIECDVLAGVECLDKTFKSLKRTIGQAPYTATGIVRQEVRLSGRKNHAHDWFKRIQPDDYHFQEILQNLFAGGYTHANRYIINEVLSCICYDESSAYPYTAITEKYPSEKFWKIKRDVDFAYILKNSEEYAFVFKAKFFKIQLRDKHFPMPYLSKDKAQVSDNEIMDNGHILSASYWEGYLTEIDLQILENYYEWDTALSSVEDVWTSYKEYLPKWFTDYVYKRFELKTKLKGVDKVNYQLEKGKLNTCAYGLLAMRPVRDDICEDYDTGEYYEKTTRMELDEAKKYLQDKYNKYLNSYGSVLPYVIAPWVTAYSRRNLFRVGSCVSDKGIWAYSDTDSAYATAFNRKKINAYNKMCLKKIKDRGYGPVEHNGREYNLGVLELDGTYMQYKTLHSKCYCDRPLIAKGYNFVMGGDLQITVAGVPKKGAPSLENNINNFKTWFVFDGKTSGKKKHTHHFLKDEDIYIDRQGNVTGDSIDLGPDDYNIKDANIPDFDGFMYDEVEVQIYDEE